MKLSLAQSEMNTLKKLKKFTKDLRECLLIYRLLPLNCGLQKYPEGHWFGSAI